MARRDPAASPPAFLGDELRHARVAAGFSSQEALAAKLGFGRSVVAKAETGERPPTPEVLEAWCSDCVEAGSGASNVYVRDSKDHDGAQLKVSAAGWRALTSRIRRGR